MTFFERLRTSTTAWLHRTSVALHPTCHHGPGSCLFALRSATTGQRGTATQARTPQVEVFYCSFVSDAAGINEALWINPRANRHHILCHRFVITQISQDYSRTRQIPTIPMPGRVPEMRTTYRACALEKRRGWALAVTREPPAGAPDDCLDIERGVDKRSVVSVPS